MTETPTTTARLVPEGKDMIQSLTVAELDMASRRVEADINAAVDNEKRWASFAVLADIWARRTGDDRREADFRKLESAELLTLLGLKDDTTDDDQVGAPEDAEDVEANPTDSALASS